MKIGFIKPRNGNTLGARYKYFQLFRKAYDVTWKSRKDFRGIDIAVVPGHHDKIFRKLNIPYIVSEHDVLTLHRGPGSGRTALEKELLENAAGVIFTSEEHQDYCENKYKLKNTTLIHLRPLKSDLEFNFLSKLPGKHLVYSGAAFPNHMRNSPGGYRCYVHIFHRFIQAGWQVHIYPREAQDFSEYKILGCKIHTKQSQGRGLYKKLSQYTAGFQGYNKDGVPPHIYSYTQKCRPNKLWEYLAAGIPTIGYNAGSGGKLYNGKWGTVLTNLNMDTLRNLELPIITEEMRQAEVIDNDLQKLNNLIDKIKG